MPLPFIKFGHCPFPYSNGPVVKRLRLRPFTAATRVRVPSGSPPIFSRSIWRHSSAGRASASHAEGHRFEFCCLHHARNHTKRCGSFAILDRSAGDRLQRVRSQILVVLSPPKQKAVAKATAFCFGFRRLCRLHPPAITVLGRSEFCLRQGFGQRPKRLYGASAPPARRPGSRRFGGRPPPIIVFEKKEDAMQSHLPFFRSGKKKRGDRSPALLM